MRLPNLNYVIVCGRLIADPSMRYTKSGVAVMTARIAVKTLYRREENWKTETCFVDIVAWQSLGERVYQNAVKDTPVMVVGRLVSSEWETETGEKRTQVEIRADRIQILEKRPDQEELPLEEEEPF